MEVEDISLMRTRESETLDVVPTMNSGRKVLQRIDEISNGHVVTITLLVEIFARPMSPSNVVEGGG